MTLNEAELQNVLLRLISQACKFEGPAKFKSNTDGTMDEKYSIEIQGEYYDSQAIGAYADALRLLADRGVIKILTEYRRRVIAVDAK